MPIIVDPAVITNIENEIDDIKQELGVDPNGVYSTVRTRLDILEARINNPLAPAPNVEDPFFIGNSGVSISTGDGYPTENRVDGSLYLRRDGYVGEGLYSRRSGAWSLVETAPWVGSGDLFGDSSSQTVIGLQNNPVSNNAPNANEVLTWDGSQWLPSVSFSAGGDLSGTLTSQTVIGLQGNAVSATAPSDAQVLTWDSAGSNWEPRTSAVVFDTVAGEVNIKANRPGYPSSVDNTKTGITNLGASSLVQDSYSAILGGRACQVNIKFSSISGGFGNQILPAVPTYTDDGHSFIGGGESNIINGADHSSILGGVDNSIGDGLGGATYSSILSGDNNSIPTGNYAAILNGKDNVVSNNYSVVIGGDTNDISSEYSAVVNGGPSLITGDYSTIINGGFNQINGLGSLIGVGGFNQINSILSAVICGSANTLDVDADYSTIISGDSNLVTDSQYVTIKGSDNTVNDSSEYSTIFGSSNTVQVSSPYVTIFGDNNDIGSGNNQIFGDSNTLASNSDGSFVKGDSNTIGTSLGNTIFGASNTIGNSCNANYILGDSNTLSTSAVNNFIFGGSNTVTGGDYSAILAQNSESTADYSFINGNKGKAVYTGQFVHAADGFGNAGYSQYSRVILSGSAGAGANFDLTIPGTLSNLALEDDKAYDICVRIVIVATNINTDCARYVYDILAQQNAGALALDNVNATLATDNGTGWTVSFITLGNELVITVDNTGSTEDRRAIATVEWREISRL